MEWHDIRWEKAVDIVCGGDQGRPVLVVKGDRFSWIQTERLS